MKPSSAYEQTPADPAERQRQAAANMAALQRRFALDRAAPRPQSDLVIRRRRALAGLAELDRLALHLGRQRVRIMDKYADVLDLDPR